MTTARGTDGEVRITPHTSELETAGILAVFGGLCVGVGVVAAARLVEVLEDSLPWLLGGGAFLVISCGLWWWRLRVVISDRGVLYLPQAFHKQYSFLWSEVEGWRWHRKTFTNTDGDDEQETELILMSAGGRETVLPSPYCREEIANELAHRIGVESLGVTQTPNQATQQMAGHDGFPGS